MPSRRAERIVIISGKDGYVPVTLAEQKAFRIEVFFTATNVGLTNYYSYEWYKKKSLYGRIKIVRGEYTTREKLVQYQNELVYSEEATLFEVVKRLQCNAFATYDHLEYMTQYIRKISTKVGASTGDENIPISAFIKPPKPISIPALQVDGIYYNMFPGCAGQLVFQTWYDDDLCLDKDGNPLTRDNRGKPPDPAFSGNPPAGTDSNVPNPTYPPGSSYQDPSPGQDEETGESTDPNLPQGEVGRFYILRFREKNTETGVLGGTGSIEILGKYGPVIKREVNTGTSIEYGLFTNIGSPSAPAGSFVQLSQSANIPPGTGRYSVQIVSITPV